MPQPTRVRYRVVGFTLLLTALAYLDRICISIAAPSMKADLGLTDTQMGLIFSAFSITYALFEVPSGWLMDRFGPRTMLTRIVVWWSMLTSATGWASGFFSLLTLRALFGAGEAGTFPGIAKVFSRWLPHRQHGTVFGLAVMTGAFGGAITQPLVAFLLDHHTWRTCFHLFGLIGIVWALAWYFWFRDDPHHHPKVNAEEIQFIGCDAPTAHPTVPWKKLISDRRIWLLCTMYVGALYGWFFYLTWLPTYLLRVHHFDLKMAGWLASLPLFGIGTGVFLGGWLSDLASVRWGKTWGRRLPGLIGFPLAAATILLVTQIHNGYTAAFCIGLAAALSALGVAPAWSACVEIGGPHSGVVGGAMNTFGNLGGALSPLVVGFCVQNFNSWNLPLATMALGYIASAICWFGISLESSSPTNEIPSAHA